MFSTIALVSRYFSRRDQERQLERLRVLFASLTEQEEFLDALLEDALVVMNSVEDDDGDDWGMTYGEATGNRSPFEQAPEEIGESPSAGNEAHPETRASPSPNCLFVQIGDDDRDGPNVTSEPSRVDALFEIYVSNNDEAPVLEHPPQHLTIIASPTPTENTPNSSYSSIPSHSKIQRQTSFQSRQHHQHHFQNQQQQHPHQQHSHSRVNHFLGKSETGSELSKSVLDMGRSLRSNTSVKWRPEWRRGSSKAAKLLSQKRAEGEESAADLHLHSIDNDGAIAACVDAAFVTSSVFSCMVALTLQHPNAAFDKLSIPPTPVIVWFAFQGLLSLVWMALRFFTRIRREWDVVDELPTIRQEYLATWFKFDLFICVPFEIFFVGWISTSVFYLMTLRHFFRYVRIFSLGKSTNPLLPSRAWLQFLTFVCTLFLVVHCVANIFWSLERRYQKQLTYTKSLYWAAITMTGVGYGDLTAKSDTGKSFSIVAMMLGVLLLSSFMTGATYFLTYTDGFTQALDDRRKMLWAMIEHLEVPDHVKIDVLRNFHLVQSNFAEHVFGEHLRMLPSFMEEKLRSHFNAGLLGTMPMFKNVSSEALIQLSSRMSKHTVGPSDVLFEAGTNTSELVFVVSGVVQLVRVTETGEVIIVDEIKQGGVIGPLTGDRAGLVARATAKVDFVKVQSKDLVEIVQDVPELASTFVKSSVSLDELTRDLQSVEDAQAVLVTMDWQSPTVGAEDDSAFDCGRPKPAGAVARAGRRAGAVEDLGGSVVCVIPQIVESIVVPSFTFAQVREALFQEQRQQSEEAEQGQAASAAVVIDDSPPGPVKRQPSQEEPVLSPRTAALELLFYDWFILLEDWFDGEDVMYVLRAVSEQQGDERKDVSGRSLAFSTIEGFAVSDHPLIAADIASFGAPRSSGDFLDYFTALTRTFSDEDVIALCHACSQVIFPLVSTQASLCVKKAVVQTYRELRFFVNGDALLESIRSCIFSARSINQVEVDRGIFEHMLLLKTAAFRLNDFVALVHQLCGPSYDRVLCFARYLLVSNRISLDCATLTVLHEQQLWHRSQSELNSTLAHAFDGVQYGAFLAFVGSTSDDVLQQLKYCIVSLVAPAEVADLTLEEGSEAASHFFTKSGGVASDESRFSEFLVNLAMFRGSGLGITYRHLLILSKLLLSSQLNPSVVLPRSRVAHALARWSLLAVQRVCHARHWAFPLVLVPWDAAQKIIEEGVCAVDIAQQSFVTLLARPRELSSTPEPPEM